MDQQHKSSQLHQEQQGPASFQQEGPAAGYSLKDLQQPVNTKNAREVMEAHHDHPKKHVAPEG